MTRIENECQYQVAMARIEKLLPIVTEDTPTTDKNSVELVLLSNLVADYSDEHFKIEKPTLAEVMALRLYEMNLTKKALAKMIGVSQSRISEYMSGKSEPTLKIARTISQQLNIDPSIVLGV